MALTLHMLTANRKELTSLRKSKQPRATSLLRSRPLCRGSFIHRRCQMLSSSFPGDRGSLQDRDGVRRPETTERMLVLLIKRYHRSTAHTHTTFSELIKLPKSALLRLEGYLSPGLLHSSCLNPLPPSPQHLNFASFLSPGKTLLQPRLSRIGQESPVPG